MRYQISVSGWERAQALKPPVLLLPNHPAFVDPILIYATFDRAFRPRMVLSEENFSGPIRPLLTAFLNAVAVPDLQHPSENVHERTERAVAELIAGLKRGENFILWPSGRIQRDGVERLGAARLLAEVLRAVPEATVVPLRTQGLWGSMFSFAQTGRLPNLVKCLLKGGLLLIANLLFFMPRRRVDITIKPVSRGELPELTWKAVNSWFEAWYNADGRQQASYVPYHFLFGPRDYQFPPSPLPEGGSIDPVQIRPETREGVTSLLGERIGRRIAPHELDPAKSLDEFGLDSLQRMDLTLDVQKRFDVSADAAPDTVGGLLALAQGLSRAEPPPPPPKRWFQAPPIQEAPKIIGESIPEAFLARALANPHRPAVADERSGLLSYERLLTAALIMSRRFARLPEDNVGLLLPAAVACDVMLLGLYLAGKRPVLLNWTTGAANLQHAVALAGLRHVVSSRQFRQRLHLTIAGVRFLDAEDLRSEVGWGERIKSLLTVRLMPGRIRASVPKRPPDAPAVILFTSGSEKAPKAVPLTHRNILSNQRAALEALKFTAEDTVLGFLPMFHSFGLTTTGLLPILAGLRIVHHADPTDAGGLLQKIIAYRPSVFVGTPTFVEHVFERAGSGDLDSLRLIIVGAEKCPDALFETVHRKAPKSNLLEGYGVTECSPVVSVNRPEAIRAGSVGQPLPGVEVCVADLETDEVLPQGRLGMLQIHGPSVFPGYLGEEHSPFVERDGTRWYVTGDLAELDAEGFIYFRGRLKRFLKAGGEMISLPALEEPFSEQYPRDQNGPHVAVEGVETDGGRRIVLFTTEPVDLEQANAKLVHAGFHGIMRLDEVRQVDSIPVLGTGKVDYRQLREMINVRHAVRPAPDGNPKHEVRHPK